MKNKLIFAVVLLFCLVLYGCSKKEYTNYKSVENILLKIKNNDLSKRKLTMILENNNVKDIFYDNSYILEIKIKDEWERILPKIYFNSKLNTLKSKSKCEIIIDLNNDFKKLEKGKYRIIKKIYIMNTDKNYLNYELPIEFSI